SGGIEGDLQKQRLRKLNFLGLVAALDAIATGAHRGLPHAAYDELPENGSDWPDLMISGATLALPGQPQAGVDVLLRFDDPLLERGGRIADVGDLDGMPARRTMDASGLYLVPLAAPGDGDDARPVFNRNLPARFVLSRDPEGRDVVWTAP